MATFNKSYQDSAEFEIRFARFQEVDAFVNSVNAPGSGYTHRAGHNQFSTWSEEEFMTMMNQPEPPTRLQGAPTHEVTADPSGSSDWVTQGCVNAIQN
jgi:hypothetical protein